MPPRCERNWGATPGADQAERAHSAVTLSTVFSQCGLLTLSLMNEMVIRSLFTEHGRALLAYATRLTRDRAAAEDIVQEALLRVWRQPPRSLFTGEGSVRGWLFTVVRNLATDRLRARRARPL